MNKPVKLIIAGGRDFKSAEHYDYLVECMDYLPTAKPEWSTIMEVVCGGAKGADTLGKEWAGVHQLPVKMFPADWTKYGGSAGPIRNEQMGDYADALVAFWDGKSRGTLHMISYMRRLGKAVQVFSY